MGTAPPSPPLSSFLHCIGKERYNVERNEFNKKMKTRSAKANKKNRRHKKP
jgi:hypothetical protein